MRRNARGKGIMMWGFIYIAAFIISFTASAVIKLKYNPLANETRVDWSDSVGRIYTDIAYGGQAANKFDLYVPADDSKESYGLVVYLHAGGFTAGDKKGDEGMLKWLCSKGYVSAGVNYTLRNDSNPDASVFSQSQEIKASIPFIKEAAEKLGYKLDRMAVSGGSAGGCLALIYAYRDADSSPIPVKMVFEAVGPASFYPEDWAIYGLDKNPEAAAGLFSVMSGSKITVDMLGTPAYEDAIRDVSAYMWVNEESVPTLCAYGAYDKVCPFASSKHLAKVLTEKNVPHDFIVFPHSGHGLQNDFKEAAIYYRKINEYLGKYLGEAS